MAYVDTDTSSARWRVPIIVLAIVVVATFARAADEEARVVLHAETQRGTADGWHGEGDVQIIYQDIDIQCDVADWNRATGEVVARGNVILDRGPSRFTAEEARFNILTKTGVFFNATAFIDPMYTFTGREIEKLDETHYRIDRATFTTCSTDGRPPWSFHVHKAKVEQEGLGHFSSSAMKIRGVPVFYMPYMVWPIKKERAAGLLFPRFGYSNTRGFNFGLPLYIPIGRSYDTTIFAASATTGGGHRCAVPAARSISTLFGTGRTKRSSGRSLANMPRKTSSDFGFWPRPKICPTSTSGRTSIAVSTPTPGVIFFPLRSSRDPSDRTRSTSGPIIGRPF
jgi:lipopolysaccharide assembly outer membrane protein LptD (OstA)